MDQGLIPRRYAKALYLAALDKGCDGRIYQLMKNLADAMAKESRLGALMANPYVPVDDKQQLLLTAAGADSTGGDAFLSDFVKLLVKNRRLDYVQLMALAYLDLYRSSNGIYLVNITSATQLSDSALKKIHSLIETHLNGGTAEYTHSVDPALIGGFIININSERLDASVNNELKQLRLKLLSE